MTTSMIRVYLLDDHEVVRQGLRALLEGAGDIEVVGESGSAVEATRRIRANGRQPEPVIVCFTGWSGMRAEQAARQAGCDAHVAKQDGLRNVDATIQRLLAGRRPA